MCCQPSEIHSGLDKLVHKGLGLFERTRARGHISYQIAEKIHTQADKLKSLTQNRLQNELLRFRNLFVRYQTLDESGVHEALAYLTEAAHRTLGLRPFPVQIMGALGLYNNYLLEMATGEGKSLTACLAAALKGWTGKPCHIITVNDYLAQRDALQMRPFYTFCHLSVGCVSSGMDPDERRENHAPSVTYTTSKEILADFLRDRLQLKELQDPSQRLIHSLRQSSPPATQTVMRGLHSVIVDEADSVLIDEAVTPLIISAPSTNQPLMDVMQYAHDIAGTLQPEIHYVVDRKLKTIRLTAHGEDQIKRYVNDLPGIWKGEYRRQEIVKQAISARELYHRDSHYVIQEKKVVIVDEFTGRRMPNRSWSHGLHQAVEIKEGLEMSDPSVTLARLSFQRFFRLFTHLSGMTGTAREAAAELWHIYNLPILNIPTNRTCQRRVLPDAYFSHEEDKRQAIIQSVLNIHATGRPILVGTRNVHKSEALAQELRSLGVPINLLNAVQDAEEASIVATAGTERSVTIATNMAGRGTDIKLGPGVAEQGGLHVIATERHEAGRIDRQLFGRCARQGDPGSVQAFVCLDDDILTRFVKKPFRNQITQAVAHNFPGHRVMAAAAVKKAQSGAKRLAARQRQNVLQADTWFEHALPFSPDLSF